MQTLLNSRVLLEETTIWFKNEQANAVKTDYSRKSSMKKSICLASGNMADSSSCVFLLEDLCGMAEDVDLSDKAMMFHEDDDFLSWCVRILQESPVSASFIDVVIKEGWSFGLEDLGNGGFFIDAENRYCLIDHRSLTPQAFAKSAHFRNAVLIAFARSLRDIWHEIRMEGFEQKFSPEDILFLERMRAADGEAIAVMISWELRCAGFADVWRYVIGSDDSDIAMAFAHIQEKSPSSSFDSSALISAFRQWFADSLRVNMSDHETLEYMDEVMRETSSSNPFGQNMLEPEDLEALSNMPCGKNYLQGLGYSLMCDPLYSNMPDQVNKTHLTHLVHDTQAVMVENVPFRDEALARKIFPLSHPVTAE